MPFVLQRLVQADLTITETLRQVTYPSYLLLKQAKLPYVHASLPCGKLHGPYSLMSWEDLVGKNASIITTRPTIEEIVRSNFSASSTHPSVVIF